MSGTARSDERAQPDAVSGDRDGRQVHDLSRGRLAAIGGHPDGYGQPCRALDLHSPTRAAERIDRVYGEGYDRALDRLVRDLVMPETDRQAIAIEVVLDGQDRREGVERQSETTD